ncbi:hypothetical protein FXO37_02055 [Capsicum annuum]|nr:hypothetical protein FXO37_02055 [Capsicum annuum]
MDSCPNFSLGLSQLDIPVGFVPGTFDFEELDFTENHSKHRNDPTTMKKLKEATTSKSKKSTSKMARKKKFDDSGRPRLPKGKILKFTIITGMKCTGDIDEFMYTSSSKSPLMLKYFPESGGGITRSKLITRVKMGNFENSEDALNLAILYFIHTFMLFQHKEAPINVAHFQMAEDGHYIHFSWGKITFEKLINSWRQDFKIKKTALRHKNIIPRILNWSVECTRPKYESFMSGMFSKCSFKNLRPTNEEVRTLDLSFSEDFVVFDPIFAVSSSVAVKMQTAGDEDQSRVVTGDDDYDDFTTGLTQEFLRKARLAKPVSTEQLSKRRKTVMFQEVSPVATNGQKSTSSHSVCRVSEIGVSPEREQLKFVPSSSSMPERTSKSNLDMEQIKSYIKTYVNEKIAELKTLISNIPNEVVKALKKEENKESLHEDEYTGPVIDITNDEPTVLEPLKTEIQDCVHIHTECPTIAKDEHNDAIEAGCTEDLTIHQSPHMKHLEDEHNDAKKANCNEELSREHSAHMKHLEDALIFDKEEATIKYLGKQHTPVMDEYIATKESFCADELNKHHSTDVTDLQDDVNVILTESDQDALDTLIFGLSTPSNTKKFDVVTPNLVTENEGSSDNEEKQRYAFDGCTIYEDMPNQLINDYSQWLELGLLKYHASKKQTDNHYLKNAPGLGSPLLDFIVAQALSKNWFYLMMQPKMCWNDETERVDWSTLKAYEGKLRLETGEISHNPFDVECVQNIPQQASDSLDCGVFVTAYAEILSEGQQVPSCEFEAASQRARYASLLWHY